VIADLVVYLSLLYVVHLFVLSRRRRPDLLPAPDRLVFVFVIPCLNEEAVIGGTLDNLLALPGDNRILVIDDGSDDRTAEIAAARDAGRVEVLQRRLPDARTGKGHALNAAVRHLRGSRTDAQSLIVSVFDADGRIDAGGLVLP
jgi:glycosyltransferase involved in cell wall biosynthesis